MPTWPQWWEKSECSLKTAGTNLTEGDLMGAANRLWYAIFQGVHAVLVFQKKPPRPDLNTWEHVNIPSLFMHDIYRPIRRNKGVQILKDARLLITDALEWRVYADYGDHTKLDRKRIRRAIAQIGPVLKCMQEKWLK